MVHVHFGLQRIEGISEHGFGRIGEIGTMNNEFEFTFTVRIEVIDMERVVVLMNWINSSLVMELTLSLQYSLYITIRKYLQNGSIHRDNEIVFSKIVVYIRSANPIVIIRIQRELIEKRRREYCCRNSGLITVDNRPVMTVTDSSVRV